MRHIVILCCPIINNAPRVKEALKSHQGDLQFFKIPNVSSIMQQLRNTFIHFCPTSYLSSEPYFPKLSCHLVQSI